MATCHIVPGALWVGEQMVKQNQPIPSSEREGPTFGLVCFAKAFLGICPGSLFLFGLSQQALVNLHGSNLAAGP